METTNQWHPSIYFVCKISHKCEKNLIKSNILSHVPFFFEKYCQILKLKKNWKNFYLDWGGGLQNIFCTSFLTFWNNHLHHHVYMVQVLFCCKIILWLKKWFQICSVSSIFDINVVNIFTHLSRTSLFHSLHFNFMLEFLFFF